MKSPSPSLAEQRTARPPDAPQRIIPDGCNSGTVVRIALGVNVAVLLAVVAMDARPAAVVSDFLAVAEVAEPVVLATLISWCFLRRRLPPQDLWIQRAVAAAVPALALLLWTRIPGTSLGALRGMPGDAMAGILGPALVAACLGAAAQHYIELRARAYSPAVDEARFQALQSRIRPHFFFNSLNAVLAVIREDPARAERMLENIAELFRAVMADVRRLVPLEQELDLCRRYVEIEQSRLGERLQVDWQIGAVHPRARVPQLLLQPLIENAVRYGAERLAGVCAIEIRVRQHGFTLEVFVANPIAVEPIQREGNQIGLANIRGRLALIYDLEARLETRVRRDRFELLLTLPIENKAVP